MNVSWCWCSGARIFVVQYAHFYKDFYLHWEPASECCAKRMTRGPVVLHHWWSLFFSSVCSPGPLQTFEDFVPVCLSWLRSIAQGLDETPRKHKPKENHWEPDNRPLGKDNLSNLLSAVPRITRMVLFSPTLWDFAWIWKSTELEENSTLVSLWRNILFSWETRKR